MTIGNGDNPGTRYGSPGTGIDVPIYVYSPEQIADIEALIRAGWTTRTATDVIREADYAVDGVDLQAVIDGF